MKNKFAIIAVATALLTSSLAMAEGTSGESKENNIAEHKAKIIASLNKEKSIIDSSIACISAAKGREDTEKCHQQRKGSMEALRQERQAEQKAHLQNKVNKLNEKINQVDQKGAEKTIK